ncbi:cell division protein SepF [Clostridiaceae bacterium HSG29]|nr:cell division protein SepF [Clostridiaceae bacterium HSG29]
MGEKITDKIKYFMGVDENTDDAKNESENENENVDETNFDKSTNKFVEKNIYAEKIAENSNKLYDISRNRMKVVIHSPKDFDECERIVQNLLENKPVILNLTTLEDGLTNKVFNFCSGALCALQGHMIKIDVGIFLLAPNNIDVTGDIKEELESKGMFNWN